MMQRDVHRTPSRCTPLVLVALLCLGAGVPFLTPAAAQEPAAAPAIEMETRTFKYVDAKAKAVSLVGDFNGWNEKLHPMTRDLQACWQVEVPLRKGKIHEYAFVVDGNMVPDPNNPLTGDSGKTSILDLASEVAPGAPMAKGGGEGGAFAVAFERLQEKLGLLTKQVHELALQLARQNELVMKKDIQIEMVRAELDAVKSQSMSAQKDLTEARVRLGEVTEKFNQLKADNAEKTAVIDQGSRDGQTQRKQIGDLQTKVNTILQEKRQATDQLATALQRADAAEKALAEMQDKYKDLVRELEEKKASLKALLGEGRTPRVAPGDGTGPKAGPPGPGPGPAGTEPPVGPGGGGETPGPGAGPNPGAVDGGKSGTAEGPGPEGGAKPPDGRVVTKGIKSNMCFISLGTKHGAKEGDIYTLYRDGAAVGKVRVFKTWEDHCAANGIDGFDARTAQENDLVKP